MPILWNSHSCHLLGQNKHLSEVILNSLRKKLEKDPHRLSLINQVFEDQIEEGIIERIPDLETYMKENPQCSFLTFMGVFREQRETTKCRVVFLSNLSENNPRLPLTVSHNQAIHAGQCLNQKLATSLLNLWFGSEICCFDPRKAIKNIVK